MGGDAGAAGRTEAEQSHVEQDTNAATMSSWVHHPLIGDSLRPAVAAGVAWQLGSLLPGSLGQYGTYASLGAITVMFPAVSDSIKEALRTVAAIMIGVLLAVATQAVSWSNALTVAIVIAVGTLIGAAGWFGGQRTWVPVAALFVLTVQGTNPDTYAVGYLTQVVLGAAVGLVANAVLFPPLPLRAVDHAVARVRRLLVGQLRQVGEVLAAGQAPPHDQWLQGLAQLGPAREQLRMVADQAVRSRRGNLRARRWGRVQGDLIELAGALERCSWLVEDLTVMLLEFEQEDSAVLRHASAQAFTAVADVLDHPDQAAVDSTLTARADARIEDLLDRIEENDFADRDRRYLVAAMAVTARRCVHTFARRHEV